MENAAKMHECCEIFSLSHSLTDRQNCSMECLANGGELCCYDECFADRSGIYRNKTFNELALINSITRGRSVDPVEIAIVENSIKYCYKTTDPNSSYLTCKIPDLFFRFIQCVLIENYKKCPRVLTDPECRTYGRFLESCTPGTSTTTTTTTATPTAAAAPTKTGPVQLDSCSEIVRLVAVDKSFLKSICRVDRSYNYEQGNAHCIFIGMQVFAINNKTVHDEFLKVASAFYKGNLHARLWVNGRKNSSGTWITYTPNPGSLYENASWHRDSNSTGCLSVVKLSQSESMTLDGYNCSGVAYTYCEY
jgi:hypothetical protein